MSETNSKGLFRSTAALAMIAGLAAFGAPANAQQAQQTPPPAEPKPAEAPASNEEEAKKSDEIVVTGSRIRRNEFTSSSPVQVITSEQTSLEGLIDTAEILQGSSVAAGSSQINNFFTGSVVEGGPGVNTISLRGLGAQRSLVLLNGRRMNPAGTRGQVGAVDLNSIPESMIDRIEILKDGASSIYGSDAVAGVINVITKRNQDSFDINFTGNAPFDGGGESFQADAAWGMQFDRGNIAISAEHGRIEPLLRGERSYLNCPQDLVKDLATGNTLDIIDPITGKSKCFQAFTGAAQRAAVAGNFRPDASAVLGGGFFPNVPGASAATNGLGDLNGQRRTSHTFANATTWVNGACAVAAFAGANAFCATPTARAAEAERRWRQSAGDLQQYDPLWDRSTAISPAERSSLFITGNYDLTPNVELYGEFLATRRQSEQFSGRQVFPAVRRENPNNPFGTVQGTNNTVAQEAFAVLIFPSASKQEVEVTRTVVGARGDFSDLGFLDGWSWDAFAQTGASVGSYSQLMVKLQELNASVGNPLLTAANGVPTSFTGVCPANAPAGCQPFNPFGLNEINGRIPQNVLDYISGWDIGRTKYEQQMFGGSITGNVIDLPAGPLALALGAEWRSEEINDVPGPLSRSANAWGFTSAGITKGEDTVREGFFEIEAPLLRSQPFAEDVTLNASARRTDYDSYGTNDTYKLGLNWAFSNEYRLRATYGTSFRAPALYEMFLANQTSFLGQGAVDPCVNWGISTDPVVRANCASLNIPDTYTGAPGGSAVILTGGGGKGLLDPETSNATSFGFIWTPEWVDFSLALDYFNIEVNGQVAQFGSFNIVNTCMASPDFPNNAFCSLFTRAPGTNATPPNNANPWNILNINDSYVNLNSQQTRGIDLTMRYRHEFSFGTLQVDSQATFTFLDKITFFDPRSAPRDFNGEMFEPDGVANIDLRFDRGDWTFFWGVDMVSKTSNTEFFANDILVWRGTPYQYRAKRHLEFQALHDASIRYRSDDWTMQVGMQNVFNEEPPTATINSGVTRFGNTVRVNQSDLRGRRAFISLSRSF